MSKYTMMLAGLTPADFGEKDIKTELIEIVQNHMDNVAQSRGYDNILSVCSYVNTGVQKFDEEGRKAREWRSAVWEYCYKQLDLYEEGKREIPVDIIAELPKLEW